MLLRYVEIGIYRQTIDYRLMINRDYADTQTGPTLIYPDMLSVAPLL